MANDVVLDKKYFGTFIASLLDTYTVFAPSRNKIGCRVAKIDAPDKITICDGTTYMSLKNFFFPQTETLFLFDTEHNKIESSQEETRPEKQNIIVGIRPCDAMAVTLLDHVFDGNNTKDPYYATRRDSTKIISYACTNPDATCFCTSVGCAPDSEAGSDIIIFELNGRYLMKPITPAGKEILQNIQAPIVTASDEDYEEKDHIVKNAKKKLTRIFEVEDLAKKLDNFDGPYWEILHQKCLGCGICTYFCPTCHCFDMSDELIKSHGRRVRTWDSCMFPLFTLHASGHNPRPTKKERMRQRIMHKFNYSKKCYGKTFCVGCGRCIINCPVNVDVRRVVKEIMEA
jgi:sulfhydrogenase subunit beta (sulfur reductase)